VQIPGHQIVTDIEGVGGDPIEPVYCLFSPFLGFLLPKTAIHLGVSGGEHSHDPADESLPLHITPGVPPLPKKRGQLLQKGENLFGAFELPKLLPQGLFHSKKTEEGVAEGDIILLLPQVMPHAPGYQRSYERADTIIIFHLPQAPFLITNIYLPMLILTATTQLSRNHHASASFWPSFFHWPRTSPPCRMK
jgi:hypothetical protein